MKYSVLMSVYAKERPERLRASVESMTGQTVPPDQLVLVLDGPLPAGLRAEVDRLADEYRDIFTLVPLAENGGLGNALREGLGRCRNELVARMDSDDIAVPDRMRLQLDMFTRHPELDLVSGAIEEFYDAPGDTGSVRRLPETQREILEFAKKRNPFNHQTVVFRKSSVLKAGSYQPFDRLEDYHLWVRMLHGGAQARNLPDVLVHMRTGREMYMRRGGFKLAAGQARFYRFMYKIGFIPLGTYLEMALLRFCLAAAPAKLRSFLYRKIARENRA